MSIPVAALSEPFPPDLVKQRKGNFGQMLDYVDTATVINRLNEALEGQWSFTVIDHHQDTEEMIVQGQLEIGGVVRQQFGKTLVTYKIGTKETVSLADDLKAATSDALKKCAASFGVGLYLYSSSTHPNTQQGNNGHHQKSNGNGRITNQMITELFSSAKQAGVPQSEVIKTAMVAYSKPISQLTRQQAHELLEQFTIKVGG